jgi:hypothetical protein
VGLERGPLSLVSTTEELLGINNSGPGLENREYGSGLWRGFCLSYYCTVTIHGRELGYRDRKREKLSQL